MMMMTTVMVMVMVMTDPGESSLSLCQILPAGRPACSRSRHGAPSFSPHVLSPRVLFQKVACNSRYSKQGSAAQSPPPYLGDRLHPRAAASSPPSARTRYRDSLCQSKAAPNGPCPPQRNLGVCVCQHALCPSFMVEISTGYHQTQIVDASSSANCRLGPDDCTSSGTVRSDILVLRANISNDPVTLSLLLSELSHGANENSRFVSLILSTQPYNATLL